MGLEDKLKKIGAGVAILRDFPSCNATYINEHRQ